jgi:hypothetical protein
VIVKRRAPGHQNPSESRQVFGMNGPAAARVKALPIQTPGAPALVFSTELAAFFKAEGFMLPSVLDRRTLRVPLDAPSFFAFRRINFGRIHLRTDGRRVVVASESAVDGIKEAYAFSVDAAGNVTSEGVAML